MLISSNIAWEYIIVNKELISYIYLLSVLPVESYVVTAPYLSMWLSLM